VGNEIHSDIAPDSVMVMLALVPITFQSIVFERNAGQECIEETRYVGPSYSFAVGVLKEILPRETTGGNIIRYWGDGIVLYSDYNSLLWRKLP
jgi:hypothetical protein